MSFVPTAGQLDEMRAMDSLLRYVIPADGLAPPHTQRDKNIGAAKL